MTSCSLVDDHRSTQHHIAEDDTFHGHQYGKLKSKAGFVSSTQNPFLYK
jgi:hypothetical protein